MYTFKMIPRNVAFVDGKAIAVGCAASLYRDAVHKVIFLPTDHYDFVGIDVVGKTEEEIQTITSGISSDG